MKKALAIFLAVMMIFSVTACAEKAPEQTPNEIRWPNTEMVNRIPKPNSLHGEVSWEYEDDFAVELLDVSREEYEEYVDACMDNGFTVDYGRDETGFYALDSDGYDLSVDYDEDMMIMSIYIEAPDDEEQDDTDDTTTEKSTTKKPNTTSTTAASADNDIDPDFKKAMDAYEKFMGEYVDFMKKYMDNPTDMSLLGDYATFMSDYDEYCDDFAAWEDEDLNDAEMDYYLEVQSRVNKKLLEVSQ